ncbi:MAG: sugar phosphate isomerase/epimerase, partial [Oscillospiraceae bacterium]|nr:sugar phosphate isomerase/epimerase [Oscillospiraceae bacterium]
MTMQFGMPTLIGLKSPEQCAALCRELGLAFVELNMNLPEYQANNLDAGQLRRIAGETGIYFTIHLDENCNPCDFNDKVAIAYTETVLQMVETAKRLAAPVLNMHMNPGIRVTLPDRKVYLFDEYQTEYLRKLTVFRDACEAAIGDADLQICIENCGDYGDKPFLQKGLICLLQSPVFALTFDIGHNAGAGYTDEPIIRKHADRLAHFHIHDASGRD